MALRQPVADIQFISDFAAFCRTKGDEEYNFLDAHNCALAQFGYPGEFTTNIRANFPAGVADALLCGTFSALADRLESLIADSPLVERG